MNSKVQSDLKFGFKSEDESQKYLEQIFGELKNTRTDDKDQYNKFDYRNDKCKIELKTRKCRFGQYPDLYFELGKIKEGIKYKKENPDKKVFFIWRCVYTSWKEEGYYYWELNEEEYNTGYGGRNDRGKDEYKILVKIKNEYIKPLFSHKPTL
mgnify:CR=1 FL=1